MDGALSSHIDRMLLEIRDSRADVARMFQVPSTRKVTYDPLRAARSGGGMARGGGMVRSTGTPALSAPPPPAHEAAPAPVEQKKPEAAESSSDSQTVVIAGKMRKLFQAGRKPATSAASKGGGTACPSGQPGPCRCGATLAALQKKLGADLTATSPGKLHFFLVKGDGLIALGNNQAHIYTHTLKMRRHCFKGKRTARYKAGESRKTPAGHILALSAATARRVRDVVRVEMPPRVERQL